MKKIIFLFLGYFYFFTLYGQEGFQFKTSGHKITIPFKLVNNLLFIPIKVNGVELNFLLDSGVEETILFSMDDTKEVHLFNIEKIKLRGLGIDESIEGLKSTNNILEIDGLKSVNHLLYIVLDQKFNLSSHVGIPVNGIIGYHFFKNNLVEINYQKKIIYVHAENSKYKKTLEKRFRKTPITIEKSKPYTLGTIGINKEQISVKLLIDIGNSDAIWLFQNAAQKIEIPSKNFEDYLGQGFSGDVFGKRAMISSFSLSKFEFNNPIVAFPDLNSTKNVKMVEGRSGSIGTEILKRFTVVFDYSNQWMYLRKNNDFDSPFSYNKSGIEIQNFGYQWVNETIRLDNVVENKNSFGSREIVQSNDFKYKLQLKPIYIISVIRNNSQAAVVGLQKEDVILNINNRPAYYYSLEKINSLLRPDQDKWLTFEVDRNGKKLVFKFHIQNEL